MDKLPRVHDQSHLLQRIIFNGPFIMCDFELIFCVTQLLVPTLFGFLRLSCYRKDVPIIEGLHLYEIKHLL